jgi:glycolate oxidase
MKESVRGLVARCVEFLRADQVVTDKEGMSHFCYDATEMRFMPDVVLLPESTQEVSRIMRLSYDADVPLTPQGGRTGLSGGAVPVAGGVLLSLLRMNRIIEVDERNMQVVVEPGVISADLQERLKGAGLFFPPDPQSFLGATMGGIIAENAGGPACVKYGVTKQYILGLEVVLPTGEIVSLGGRTLKNVVGYDLLHLFVSSEGTLGVITRAELKLNPLPPARKTVVAVYDDVATAGESVYRVLAHGVIPGKIELIDNWVINRIEEMMPIGLPRDADAVLLFECDGIAEAVDKEAGEIVEITRECGAKDVRVAKDADEANLYWLARRAGFAAVFGRAKTVLAEDVTVPRGRIPDLIKRCKELARKYDVEVTVLGHAGDGNLHPSIMTDASNKEHYERANKAMEGIIEGAVEMGGVLSGEHGIGLEKQRFFNKVTDPVVVSMMKGIKSLLDPNDIMNPGKIWE